MASHPGLQLCFHQSMPVLKNKQVMPGTAAEEWSCEEQDFQTPTRLPIPTFPSGVSSVAQARTCAWPNLGQEIQAILGFGFDAFVREVRCHERFVEADRLKPIGLGAVDGSGWSCRYTQ